MAGENLESIAFREVYNKLSTGIRAALPTIAIVAFARQLIHDNTHSEAINLNVPIDVRTQNFLNALRDRIRADPSAFHTFADILKEENSMGYLATMLKGSLQQIEERIRTEDPRMEQFVHKLTKGETEMPINTQQFVVGETPLRCIYDASQSVPKKYYHNQQVTGVTVHSSKPTKLYIRHTNDIGHLNKTPDGGKDVQTRYPQPLSEPTVKHTASPMMAFRNRVSLPGTKVTDSTGEFNALTRRAITPDSSRKIVSTATGPASEQATRMFRKNYR